MPRKRRPADPIAILSGGIVSETTHGGVRENFLPLPVDRLLELRWELGEDFAGEYALDERSLEAIKAGARVKPVIFVPESKLELVDREAVRTWLLELGAKYVRAPLIHVARRTTRRDARHDVEIPLEESIRIFADETRPRDKVAKRVFAAALAREADAGARE